jgi:hypothetical protein
MLESLKWAGVFLALTVVSIPLNGLVISASWGWFVSPITGARPITLVEGVGLSIFLSGPVRNQLSDPVCVGAGSCSSSLRGNCLSGD